MTPVKARYANYRNTRRCPNCGNNSIMAYCDTCLDKRRQNMIELRLRRLAENRCYACGFDLIDGEIKYCVKCSTHTDRRGN